MPFSNRFIKAQCQKKDGRIDPSITTIRNAFGIWIDDLFLHQTLLFFAAVAAAICRY